MILEIESYFGDCTLSGPDISREELETQIETIKQIIDSERELAALLCRRFHWTPAGSAAPPQYRYDSDIDRLFEVQY